LADCGSPASLDALVEALRRLPGVGVKSASRMAFHLLQHDREGAQLLARAAAGRGHIRHCSCATPSPRTRSAPPAGPAARRSKLCVVETPADQAALERTRPSAAYYFVLMGKLSPLDGIGPNDIGLQQAVRPRDRRQVQEVILATNFTAEGRSHRARHRRALKQRGLKVTRLARGVPAGSELEYVDLGTIAHALVDRR
jgi:recombination protein RecR